jgi:peptidoglycan/xylan/chitin deacetylase (PgdA/CDA1 family)
LTVTFDDDLSSHRIAAATLAELRLTGTFFLTGATLEGPSGFWWQRLQACYEVGLGSIAAARAGVEEAGIHTVALTIQHMPRTERERIADQLGELLGGAEPEAGLRADDVRALVASRAEVGFHTLHHDFLPDLPDEALELAVSEGRDLVESAVGGAVRTIAYPHGGADRRVAAAAGRGHFEFGFAGEPSAIGPDDDPLLLARIEPPRAGAGRFGMRIARHLVEGLRT